MISSNSFFASSFAVCFVRFLSPCHAPLLLHCCLHYFRYFMSQYFAAMWRACTEVRATLHPPTGLLPLLAILRKINGASNAAAVLQFFSILVVVLAFVCLRISVIGSRYTHTLTHILSHTHKHTHIAYLFVRSFVFVLLNIVNNCPQAAFPLCLLHSPVPPFVLIFSVISP